MADGRCLTGRVMELMVWALLCLTCVSAETLSPLASAFRIMVVPSDLDRSIQVVKPNQKVAVQRNSSFDLSCYTSAQTLDVTFKKWLPTFNVSQIEMAWFRDGRPFHRSPNALVTGWLNDELREDYQIHFDQFTAQDGGDYECHVTLGPFKLTINATIGLAPYLVMKPAPYEYAAKGSNLALQCQAFGYPQPQVSWWNMKTNQVVAKHNHLFVLNLRRKHSGMYKCVARNSVGETSAVTSLTVTEPLRWVGKSAPIVSSKLGDLAALECHAKGFPSPSVQWTFTPTLSCSNDAQQQQQPELVKPQAIPLNATGWRLAISQVTKRDLGVYKCVVESRPTCCPTVTAQPALQMKTCLSIDPAAVGSGEVHKDNALATGPTQSISGLDYSSAAHHDSYGTTVLILTLSMCTVVWTMLR
ncbi:hemicentin-2-like isoform X1 [Sycon ciliatum]|uniref:hemicentin-2-like isoform X1 n=1 Tax=Sycon ciliatum TaxID=27933 RepID=UPI0031F63315